MSEIRNVVTHDTAIVLMMEIFGGSFVQALAKAYQKADIENQGRLRAAFPEYWAKYAEIARQQEEQG